MRDEQKVIEYMEEHGIDITTMQKDIGAYTVSVTIEKNPVEEEEDG